jgi:RNA polymerase sigma-70 factor (ECF subfamily)
MTPEENILKGCKEGDRQAQGELYKKYASSMFGVCLRYSHCREDAEDVLHEAFVKVFTNIGLYRGQGSFEGWMRRIMVNSAIDHYRVKVKHQFVNIDDIQVGNEAEGNELSEENIFHENDGKPGSKEIMNMMQQLPDGYRIVLNLFVIEKLNHKEISELLGISESGSKSQLFKARRFMRKLLDEKYSMKPKDLSIYELG